MADHPKHNAEVRLSTWKKKLCPDCMIVEITQDVINSALKKWNRSGDNNIHTQINSKPMKIWLITHEM
jgi:hypothetical protein